MNTIISKDKGTKRMAIHTKETQAWLREAGDTCWERGIGDRLSDRVVEAASQSVSEPGIDHEGEVGMKVRELFVMNGGELGAGWTSLAFFLKTTRVDHYPD